MEIRGYDRSMGMAHLEKRSHLKRSSPAYKLDKLHEDKITPERLYLSRRKFIVGMGAIAATAFLAACTRQTPGIPTTPSAFCDDARAAGTTDERGDSPIGLVTTGRRGPKVPSVKDHLVDRRHRCRYQPVMCSSGPSLSRHEIL